MNSHQLKTLAKQSSLLDDSRWVTIGHALTNAYRADPENFRHSYIFEVGAYKGGTGLWMLGHIMEILGETCLAYNQYPRLFLFDSFEGMPVSGANDIHKIGTFSDTSYDNVVKSFSDYSNVTVVKGTVPSSFVNHCYDSNVPISVAHVDVDQYESVRGSLEYIYPLLIDGGYIIIDDYGCPNCPGAKKAVDEFLDQHKDIRLEGNNESTNPQRFFVKPWTYDIGAL